MTAPPTREEILREIDWQLEFNELLFDGKVRLKHLTQEQADHKLACLREAKRIIELDRSKVATALDVFGDDDTTERRSHGRRPGA